VRTNGSSELGGVADTARRCSPCGAEERERGRCGSSDVALGGHGEVADSADNNVEERCRMKLGAPVLQGATCRRDDMRRERRPRGLNRSDS
jgi:hypothetical protein